MREEVPPVAPILALSGIDTLNEFLELEKDDHDEANCVAGLDVLVVFRAGVEDLDDEREHVQEDPNEQLEIEEDPRSIEQCVINFHENRVALDILLVFLTDPEHEFGQGHDVCLINWKLCSILSNNIKQIQLVTINNRMLYWNCLLGLVNLSLIVLQLFYTNGFLHQECGIS